MFINTRHMIKRGRDKSDHDIARPILSKDLHSAGSPVSDMIGPNTSLTRMIERVECFEFKINYISSKSLI